LGEWILKLGHPGHYRVARPSAVRLGRVLSRTEDGYSTDCMINGGDSGGPFFDLEGRLAGIVRGTTADLGTLIPTESDSFSRYNSYLFSATSNAAILARFDAMRGGAVDETNGNNFDIPLVKAARLPAKDWSQGAATRAAFRSAAESSRASVVVVLNGSIPVALGTVVERDGDSAWLATKASELPRRPTCRLPGGAVADAEVVGIDSAFDLALLKVTAPGLRPVTWAKDFAPKAGTLVASVGTEETPFAVGVVSIPRRDGADGLPQKLDDPRLQPAALPTFLGHVDKSQGLVVDQVFTVTAFATGLRSGDVLRSVGGRPIRDDGDVAACLKGRVPGDFAVAEILRGGERREIQLVMIAAGAPVGANSRSSGFPSVFEHATPVQPNECGGPVVDLDGRVLGITIARYDLIGCKAIPGDHVKRLIPELRSGRLDSLYRGAPK
jgi:serine protease Do